MRKADLSLGLLNVAWGVAALAGGIDARSTAWVPMLAGAWLLYSALRARPARPRVHTESG